MALPPRLLTSLVHTEGAADSKPSLRRPIWHFKPETEEAVLLDETVAPQRDKRLKFESQADPTTPGARSTDDQKDDDEESVGSGVDSSGPKKWPFEQVAAKLEAAIWEVTQLRDSMKNPGVVLSRVERTPLSASEVKDSLALGLAKRSQSFAEAEAILSASVKAFENEIKAQREYVDNLARIHASWRVVAPTHNMNSLSSLRSEELLAVDLESGVENSESNLVHLKRDPNSAHGITLTSKTESDRGDFRAHSILAEFVSSAPPFRVEGQASTMLFGREQKSDATALPGGIFLAVEQPGESIDGLIEARFRDAHARGLMAKLGQKYELKLSEIATLRFELVPEKKSYEIINEYDAICSLALNLLERGKSAEQIQAACMQKLAFRRCFDALAKVPGAGGLVWRHDSDTTDEPEKIQSRCCIEVGRTGSYAIEFVLSKGVLSLSWCSLPNYLPKIAHNLSSEQAFRMACEVSVGALVRELVALASRDDRMFCDSVKRDSFRIVSKASRHEAVLSGRVELDNQVIRVTFSMENDEQMGYALEQEERLVCILSEDGDSNSPRDPYYALRRLLNRSRPA